MSLDDYADQISILNGRGLTIREIAEKIGCKYDRLHHYFKRNNIKHIDGRLVPKKVYPTETLIKLYHECNGNYSEIARQLGASITNMGTMFKSRGLYEKYPPSKRAKRMLH